ncbi:MAG: serine/threonine-protein kinase [bacterium]
MTILLEKFETDAICGGVWLGRVGDRPVRVRVLPLADASGDAIDLLEASLHRTRKGLSVFENDPIVVGMDSIIREGDRILVSSRYNALPTIDQTVITASMVREITLRLLDVYQAMHERGIYFGAITPKDLRIDVAVGRINALEVDGIGLCAAYIRSGLSGSLNKIWRSWLPGDATTCSVASDLYALGCLLTSLLLPLGKSEEVAQMRQVGHDATQFKFEDVHSMRAALQPERRPRARTPRLDASLADSIASHKQDQPTRDVVHTPFEVVAAADVWAAEWEDEIESIDLSINADPHFEPSYVIDEPVIEKPTVLLTTMTRRIGPLELLDVIGTGAFSTVYKAYHDLLDRHVAVKMLSPVVGTSADDVQRMSSRLLREGRLAGKLSGTYSVPVYDAGMHEDMPYIVMEFVEGVTLHEFLREHGALSERQAARFAVPILKGLVEAHHHGIIHRDLKPSNLMVTRDFTGNHTIRILDYGIAIEKSRVLNTASPTRVGEFVGSPQYAAPEQFVGESGPQSDIYAVGVTLCEIITRKRLCSSRDFEACFLAHTSPDPWEIPASSPGFADILTRAVAKYRGDRYNNALEMLEDMQAWLIDPHMRLLTVEPV